jgi:hypothetical protein
LILDTPQTFCAASAYAAAGCLGRLGGPCGHGVLLPRLAEERDSPSLPQQKDEAIQVAAVWGALVDFIQLARRARRVGTTAELYLVDNASADRPAASMTIYDESCKLRASS